MREPPFYREYELAQKWKITQTTLRDQVFEGRDLRPSLRNSDIGSEYHLCLYVGQFSHIEAGRNIEGGNYLLPSSGVLRLTREDGTLVPEDEWYYLKLLDKSLSELDAAEPIVVVQSGEKPVIPEWINSMSLPPATPASRVVRFEMLDGAPLFATYVGALTEELAGMQISSGLILVADDLNLIFTSAEVTRFWGDTVDEPEGCAVPYSTNAEPLALRKPAAWSLREPKRPGGYILPLYHFLRAAHDAGKSKPSSADVLRAWKDHPPPPEYGINVNPRMTKITYHGNGRQPVREADSQAISKAILRMTSP